MKKVLVLMLFLGVSIAYGFNASHEIDKARNMELLKPSVEGLWNGSIDTPNGLLVFTITYTVKGKSISGVINSEYGELAFADGKVEGDTFEYSFDINGTPQTHKGKLVKDNEIVLSYTNSQGVDGELTLTRAEK